MLQDKHYSWIYFYMHIIQILLKTVQLQATVFAYIHKEKLLAS